MTKMPSHLCRSRDVSFKSSLIICTKNSLTTCMKRCDSLKTDIFDQNYCSKDDIVSETQESLRCCSQGSLFTMLTTLPCTRLRCQSLSSLPHPFTEIHQCAKDGCTLEDLSPIREKGPPVCTQPYDIADSKAKEEMSGD